MTYRTDLGHAIDVMEVERQARKLRAATFRDAMQSLRRRMSGRGDNTAV